jgi:hypothetical protein
MFGQAKFCRILKIATENFNILGLGVIAVVLHPCAAGLVG